MDLGLINVNQLGSSNIWSTTGIVTMTLIAIQIFAGRTFTNCDDTSAGRQILHSLVHGSSVHLLVNIFTFIQLYRLEQILGSRDYFILIMIILVLSSWLYWIMNKVLYGTYFQCSVGFSGVLFGLLVWSRMVVNGGSFDLREILLWSSLLIIPVLQNPRISLLGHLSGLLVGLLLWPILSPILLGTE
jgi:membrane associated rhomboid family serine protease